MLINILMLIGGLIVLVKGSSLFIDAASEIAKRMGISEMIIGLTLVAFGTSLPEWISSLIAAFRDPSELPCANDSTIEICSATDLALGNVIGSNIANIGMVLGIVGIVISGPILASKKFLMRDIPLLITLAIVSWYFALVGHQINRWEGLAMFLLFLIVTFFTFLETTKKESVPEMEPKDETIEDDETKFSGSSVVLLAFWTSVGFACLILGSHFLVDGASGIALNIGIPESTVATTLVAFGTSVPELATSITAGKKGRFDMLLGGIIGSNIANTAVVLGTVAFLVPVAVQEEIILIHFPVMMLFSILLWIFMLDEKIKKWQSSLLVTGYVCFSGFLFYIS
jgi:cation:H+ antiporter